MLCIINDELANKMFKMQASNIIWCLDTPRQRTYKIQMIKWVIRFKMCFNLNPDKFATA